MRRSFLLLVICSALLISCAETNVDTIRGGVIQVDDYRDFSGTERQVWDALVSALSEKEIIKTFDHGSGLIVTDYGTVDGRELEAFKTLLLAKTYKYSYTVNLQRRSSNTTRIKVKVNLIEQQVGFYKRETRDIAVEKYLTKDLFDRVCRFLSPGNPYNCTNQRARRNTFEQQTKYDNNSSLPPQKSTGNAQTRAVQQRLLQLGYAPGPADGQMGKKTRNAIMRFQEDNGLTAHSKLDRTTLQTLGVGGIPESAPQKVADKKAKSSAQEAVNADRQTRQPLTALEKNQPSQTPKQDSQIDDNLKGYSYVTLSPTIVKKEASVMSKDLGKIAENSPVIVLQEGATWHKVRFQNQQGYVLATVIKRSKTAGKHNEIPAKNSTKKAYTKSTEKKARPVTEKKLKKTPAPQKQTPPQKTESIGRGIITGPTNLYAKPSVMSSKKMKIKQGNTVEIYGEQKDFYQVKVGGEKGFVYKDFVEINNK